MSPKEAGEIIDDPNWVELWAALKAADDGFEVILTRWRRWHWTPIMVDGVEKKKPASATDGMIALAKLGIMPPRTLIPEHEGYQHDDHMFLMSEGREWRIVGVEDKILVLISDGEQWHIDLSRAKWENYTKAAVAALAARAASERKQDRNSSEVGEQAAGEIVS